MPSHLSRPAFSPVTPGKLLSDPGSIIRTWCLQSMVYEEKSPVIYPFLLQESFSKGLKSHFSPKWVKTITNEKNPYEIPSR